MDILTIATREGNRAADRAQTNEEQFDAYYGTVKATRRRGRKAEQILEAGKVERNDEGCAVESQNGDRTYHVDVEARECDCPDRQHRGVYCKHLQAAEIYADAHDRKTRDVYALAREIVETEGQWYSGQSRRVWAGDTHSVVVQEYGRDGGGLLGLQIRNGSDSKLVECGHLSVETGRWLWTLSRSEYESWVEKARRI